MSDFKSRLQEEKDQLDEKREKLQAFQQSPHFLMIDNVQRQLLNIQYLAMTTYSQCLHERLISLS